MKPSRLRIAVTLTVASLAAAAIASSPETVRQRFEPGHAAQALTGSWLVEVTIDNPPPGVPPKVLALRTYGADGTVVESGASRLASGGHGTWARFGNRRFRAGWSFFRFTDAGTLLGVQHVIATTVLRSNGERLEGTGSFVLVSLTGQELFRGTATESGTRLRLD